MGGNLGGEGCGSVATILLVWRVIGRRPLPPVARTTEPQCVSITSHFLPGTITDMFSGSHAISVAELLEAGAKQGLQRHPASRVPLGEVGIS